MTRVQDQRMNQITVHQKINTKCASQWKGQPSLLMVLFSRAFIIPKKTSDTKLTLFFLSERDPYNTSEWSLLKLDPRHFLQH